MRKWKSLMLQCYKVTMLQKSDSDDKPPVLSMPDRLDGWNFY